LSSSRTFQNFEVAFAEEDSRIVIVTMNRPPVNALTSTSYEEVCAIVQMLHDNQHISAVVLRSEGKVFCAGADVKTLASDTMQDAAIRRALLRKAAHEFYNAPVPIIAAVQGGAVGAGAILAASSDIVIASDNAFFALTEIDIGVVGGAKGLSRFLPPQKIRAMVFTGQRVPASEAYRLGGVEAVVSPDELLPTAMNYAKLIASKGSIAVRKWKESLLLTESVGPREGFMIEMCLSQELGLFSQVKRASE